MRCEHVAYAQAEATVEQQQEQLEWEEQNEFEEQLKWEREERQRLAALDERAVKAGTSSSPPP